MIVKYGNWCKVCGKVYMERFYPQFCKKCGSDLLVIEYRPFVSLEKPSNNVAKIKAMRKFGKWVPLHLDKKYSKGLKIDENL